MTNHIMMLKAMIRHCKDDIETHKRMLADYEHILEMCLQREELVKQNAGLIQERDAALAEKAEIKECLVVHLNRCAKAADPMQHLNEMVNNRLFDHVKDGLFTQAMERMRAPKAYEQAAKELEDKGIKLDGDNWTGIDWAK